MMKKIQQIRTLVFRIRMQVIAIRIMMVLQMMKKMLLEQIQQIQIPMEMDTAMGRRIMQVRILLILVTQMMFYQNVILTVMVTESPMLRRKF